MLAYYLMLILPTFEKLSLAIIDKSRRGQKIVLFTFFLILIVILMLRNTNVGCDLPAYEYYFDYIAKTSWLDILNPFYVRDIEWGYVIFNKITSFVYYNFHFFLAVTACLAVLPIAFLYISESKLPFLTIILFVNMPTFVLLFSGLRQAIAIAIGGIAFSFVKARRPIKFICAVICACLFHISALILLAMYPAYHKSVTSKSLPFILVIFICLVLFAKEIFLTIVPFLGSKYASRYTAIEETGAYAMLLLFFLFTIFSFVFVNEKRVSHELLGFRNFLLINLFIQAFAPINAIAMRLGYYYLIYIPLLIPMVITQGKRRYKFMLNMAHIVMLVFFFVYYFWNAYHGEDILHVYPYDTFI